MTSYIYYEIVRNLKTNTMYKFRRTVAAAGGACLLLGMACGLGSWTGMPVHTTGMNLDLYVSDTVPQKGESLDDQIKAIEQAQQQLTKELSGKDWDAIDAKIEGSLASINEKEIEAQMEKAMQQLEKSMAEVKQSQLARQLDVKKLQEQLATVQANLEKNLDKKEIEAQLKAAMVELKSSVAEISKVNEAELKEELSKMKAELAANKTKMAADIAKAKAEIKASKPKIKASLEKAKLDIEAARKEFEGYKAMIGQMQQNGLISDPKNYDIEWKNGELWINGKQQPAEIRERYKTYFKRDPTHLKNTDDSFRKNDDGTIHL